MNSLHSYVVTPTTTLLTYSNQIISRISLPHIRNKKRSPVGKVTMRIGKGKVESNTEITRNSPICHFHQRSWDSERQLFGFESGPLPEEKSWSRNQWMLIMFTELGLVHWRKQTNRWSRWCWCRCRNSARSMYGNRDPCVTSLCKNKQVR